MHGSVNVRGWNGNCESTICTIFWMSRHTGLVIENVNISDNLLSESRLDWSSTRYSDNKECMPGHRCSSSCLSLTGYHSSPSGSSLRVRPKRQTNHLEVQSKATCNCIGKACLDSHAEMLVWFRAWLLLDPRLASSCWRSQILSVCLVLADFPHLERISQVHHKA